MRDSKQAGVRMSHIHKVFTLPEAFKRETFRTPVETASVTRYIGGWVGPRVSLDAVEKKSLAPVRNGAPIP
jgi:hypothetical protein